MADAARCSLAAHHPPFDWGRTTDVGQLYLHRRTVVVRVGVGVRHLSRIGLWLALLLVLSGCRGTAATPTPPPMAVPTVAATALVTASATAPDSPTTAPATPAPANATPVSLANICAFAPPFERAATPVARPSPAAVPSGQPTRRPSAPLPEQVPPSLPLPNLAARYSLAVDRYVSRADRSDFHTAETVAVTNREGCALDRLTFSVTAARWGWFTLNGVQVAGQVVAARVGRRAIHITVVRYQVEGQPSRIAPGPGERMGPHGTRRIHESRTSADLLSLTQPCFLTPRRATDLVTKF